MAFLLALVLYFLVLLSMAIFKILVFLLPYLIKAGLIIFAVLGLLFLFGVI